MNAHDMDIVRNMLLDVHLALEPEIQAVIDEVGSVWPDGPRGLLTCTFVPEMPFFCGTFGDQFPVDYAARWPEDKFGVLAIVKAAVSLAEGKPSEECRPNSLILATPVHTLQLRRNWMGGVADGPFSSGGSGLTEKADKRAALLLLPAAKAGFEDLVNRGAITLAA